MILYFENIFNYLSKGGTTMVPLILSSVVMWTLIFERVLFFRSLSKEDSKNISEDNYPVKIMAGWLSNTEKGIESLLLRRVSEVKTSIETFESAVDQCTMKLSGSLKKYLSIIAVLAAVSPLFGLLGTVTGMISTFDIINLFGTGNARAMAGGISEALVTTQSGLMVSIPGFFMGVMLSRKASNIEKRLNKAALVLKRSAK